MNVPVGLFHLIFFYYPATLKSTSILKRCAAYGGWGFFGEKPDERVTITLGKDRSLAVTELSRISSCRFFKDVLCFFLINIKTHSVEFSASDTFYKVFGIHKRTSGCIYENNILFHKKIVSGIDKMILDSVRGQWSEIRSLSLRTSLKG